MTAKTGKGSKPINPTSKIKQWTDTAIRNLKQSKLWRIDRNLYLRVNERGKYWIFRWRDPHQVYKSGVKKLRDMGLGFYGKQADQFTLQQARVEAAKWRAVIRDGGDPVELRRQERAAGKPLDVPSFAECRKAYIETHSKAWSNPKHSQQWTNTLKKYAEPVIGSLRVDQIEDAHVLAILEPIWVEKHETASRVRGRVERVLSWAEAKGYRKGLLNPARRDGPLAHSLPKVSKAKGVKHHAALPYGRMNEFVTELRGKDGLAARALEFVILTACRTSEAVASQWSEFDLDARVWTIPAERTKTKRAHRVPLSDRVLELLATQKGLHKTFVFPSPHKGKHLSNGAMLQLVRTGMTEFKSADGRPIVPHGFRSSFKDWASEQTSFANVVSEYALAHVSKDATEQAYMHTDLLQKRVPLMDQWAKFVEQETPKGNVALLHHKEGLK